MRIRSVLVGSIVAFVVMACALPAEASPTSSSATVVRVLATSSWIPGSPDPTGVAYQRSTGRLLVVDSEVDESTGAGYHGVNAWFTSRRGRVVRTFATLGFTPEPTDVAVKGARGRTLFFTDDNRDRVFVVRPGADGRWGTGDDQVSSFSTHTVGNRDPEGISFARLRSGNALFVLSGRGNTVYRITPGPDRQFDGAAPAGDDQVTSFSVLSVGLRNPKGIAVDAAHRRLFLVGYNQMDIVQTTLKGQLRATIDISTSGIVHPSGITIAPGSEQPRTRSLYVTDKGIDNNDKPSENDGQLFEFSLAP
jgi:DNA-binding beta-propeller fold protein YncE